jgi:hypothetical protein
MIAIRRRFVPFNPGSVKSCGLLPKPRGWRRIRDVYEQTGLVAFDAASIASIACILRVCYDEVLNAVMTDERPYRHTLLPCDVQRICERILKSCDSKRTITRINHSVDGDSDRSQWGLSWLAAHGDWCCGTRRLADCAGVAGFRMWIGSARFDASQYCIYAGCDNTWIHSDANVRAMSDRFCATVSKSWGNAIGGQGKMELGRVVIRASVSLCIDPDEP